MLYSACTVLYISLQAGQGILLHHNELNPPDGLAGLASQIVPVSLHDFQRSLTRRMKRPRE
jgi:hypothetical protein